MQIMLAIFTFVYAGDNSLRFRNIHAFSLNGEVFATMQKKILVRSRWEWTLLLSTCYCEVMPVPISSFPKDHQTVASMGFIKTNIYSYLIKICHIQSPLVFVANFTLKQAEREIFMKILFISYFLLLTSSCTTLNYQHYPQATRYLLNQ